MSAEQWMAELERLLPGYRALWFSETQEDFIDACERLVSDAVRRLEKGRSTYRKLGERDLSRILVELLGEPTAAGERDQNGHVDVQILHPRSLGFAHLTECKIWGGAATHRGGMRQLIHYATGRERRVLLLSFFIHHKRMVFLLERLHEELDAGGEPATTAPCAPHPTLGMGAFISQHEHPSGASLQITHLGCFLFEEEDEPPAAPP